MGLSASWIAIGGRGDWSLLATRWRRSIGPTPPTAPPGPLVRTMRRSTRRPGADGSTWRSMPSPARRSSVGQCSRAAAPTGPRGAPAAYVDQEVEQCRGVRRGRRKDPDDLRGPGRSVPLVVGVKAERWRGAVGEAQVRPARRPGGTASGRLEGRARWRLMRGGVARWESADRMGRLRGRSGATYSTPTPPGRPGRFDTFAGCTAP